MESLRINNFYTFLTNPIIYFNQIAISFNVTINPICTLLYNSCSIHVNVEYCFH